MKLKALGLLLVALPALGGCSIGKKAFSIASVRSGCEARKIEVVSDRDGDAVLNVCGVYEDWYFSPIDGWVYKGPSANQPLAKAVDSDGDGVGDDVDQCPVVPGVASLDPKKNGCPAPVDTDSDGIPDEADKCPTVVGVAHADPNKNGCPPDADNDKIADTQDACPDVPGVADSDPAKNGCPSDKDGDGVADTVDACPDVAGPATTDPLTTGCPDGDGDAIPDKVDACPKVKGSADKDPKKHGCLHRVVVTLDQIVINERVRFATGSPRIKKQSNPLLDDVAAVLKDNPRILKVEVQGHTDDRGSASLNKRLSQLRADAVMHALVKRGVAKERLVAKGYGMDKPIADNGTEQGKAKNRRVQFNILEQKKAQVAAPITGTGKAVPDAKVPDAKAPDAKAPAAQPSPADAVKPDAKKPDTGSPHGSHGKHSDDAKKAPPVVKDASDVKVPEAKKHP